MPEQCESGKDWLPPFFEEMFPKTEDAKWEPLVDGKLIRYPAFDDALEQLLDLDDIETSKLSEHSVLLVADSRMGKTRLVKELVASHPPFWTTEGLQVPVLYVLVPEHPTIRAMATAILAEFREEPGRAERAGDLTNRAVQLCRSCGVRVICFDDLHQMVDSNGKLTQSSLANWLRLFSVRAQSALLTVGLDRLEDALRCNEQLYNRLDCKIRLQRFNWMSGRDRSIFNEIVTLLYANLSSEFDLGEVTPELAFRWYLACGGRVGMLIKIARRTVKMARKAKARVLTLELLDKAWARSDFESTNIDHRNRPFTLVFDQVDGAALAAAARSRGREEGPRESSRGNRSSGTTKRTARKRLREALTG